jgi:ABC-type Fe3+-hydroxamate transport system substrate-binding protein
MQRNRDNIIVNKKGGNMKRDVKWFSITLMVLLAMFSACSNPPSEDTATGKKSAVSTEVTLTVLNPQGSVKIDKTLAPRLDTLKGKKIAMWLSATPDQLYAGKGAELYDLLEKMFKDKYPDTQIVHYADLPMKYTPENEVVDAIVKTEPDAVVVGFGG